MVDTLKALRAPGMAALCVAVTTILLTPMTARAQPPSRCQLSEVRATQPQHLFAMAIQPDTIAL